VRPRIVNPPARPPRHANRPTLTDRLPTALPEDNPVQPVIDRQFTVSGIAPREGQLLDHIQTVPQWVTAVGGVAVLSSFA
jgi:riboflavin biosynthesis pyrimidine reductase